MIDGLAHTLAILAVFFFAGLVKGVVGLGMPVLAIGMLSLLMPPAQAVALLTAPGIVTNVWQSVAGPHLSRLLARLWAFLLANFVMTLAGLWTGFLASDKSGHALAAIGAALVIYGLLALSPLPVSVPKRGERWLSVMMGAATGLIASATGVLAVPCVPYLEALGLRRDELIQALGMTFLVTTAALTIGLTRFGVLDLALATLSLAALVPAMAGMAAGQWLRSHIQPRAFRIVFLLGLIALGGRLLLQSLS